MLTNRLFLHQMFNLDVFKNNWSTQVAKVTK